MLASSPIPQRKMKKNCPYGNASGQHIKVFVRVRPMNDAERSCKALSLVECPNSKEVVVQERPLDKYSKKFSFDRVFDGKSKQIDIYKSVARPLVEEVLNGFNCTIFAYGQTGTGKTFTMEGDHYPEGSSVDDSQGAGIIPRCVNELFDELRIQKLEFTMRVSFLELYNEELFDLLSAQDDLSKLRIYEDSARKGSCIIQGLEEVLVRSKSDVYNIIEKGSAKRQTAATLMNAHSSRSHTVFTVTVHIKENTLEGDELLKTGKLHLVDLAGSENIGRSGAVDKRAREAGNINQSLLTLGRVITSLVEKAPHVPYRESKLTRLLQDALGGRTKTSIIATVSPASINFEETLSTLDYAHRAKNIQNKPEVNQKLNKKELICEYTNEIEKLRRDLLAMREKNGVYLANENYQELVSTMEQQAQEISEKISQIRSLELELEKQIELFTETKQKLVDTHEKLNETESKFIETKEVLQCTQKLLSKTAVERDEQKYLVSAHVKTESVLLSQRTSLIDVAKTTTTDISELHDKLDRKRKVECINEDVEKSFSREFEEKISAMNASIHAFNEYHSKNSDSIIDELANYVSTSNDILESQRNQLKEMNSSMLSALENTHSFFVGKGEEIKDKISSYSENILEKTSTEEKLSNQFIKEVFQPLTLQMSQLIIKQYELIQSLNQGINTKISELSKNCGEIREEEASLLVGMESKLIELIPFPSLLAEQIHHKSKMVYDNSRSHSQAMRILLKQLQDETNCYEEFISTQLPILTSEQERSISQAEQASKDLLKDVNNLAKLSSDHKKFMLEKEKEIELFMSENVIKFEDESKNMEKEVTAMETEVKQHANQRISALNQICEMSREFKIETIENVSSSESKSKEKIQETSEEVSSKASAYCEEMRKFEDKMEIVISSAQEDLLKTESQLEEFLIDHCDQIKESGECVQTLLAKQLVKDIPTGRTPSRREYLYPESLTETSPHERLLNRLRIKMNSGSKIPLPLFNKEDELDLVEQIGESVSCDSSLILDTGYSSGNGSGSGDKFPLPLSRSTSFKENESIFVHPPKPTRQESKEQLSSKQNSLSRSSSASSLTDSKENVNGSNRRTVNTKKREIKAPSTVTCVNPDKLGDVQQTRARKILGPYN